MLMGNMHTRRKKGPERGRERDRQTEPGIKERRSLVSGGPGSDRKSETEGITYHQNHISVEWHNFRFVIIIVKYIE